MSKRTSITWAPQNYATLRRLSRLTGYTMSSIVNDIIGSVEPALRTAADLGEQSKRVGDETYEVLARVAHGADEITREREKMTSTDNITPEEIDDQVLAIVSARADVTVHRLDDHESLVLTDETRRYVLVISPDHGGFTTTEWDADDEHTLGLDPIGRLVLLDQDGERDGVPPVSEAKVDGGMTIVELRRAVTYWLLRVDDEARK